MGKDIFKRTTTGAIQLWRQEFNETGDGYCTVSGQVDGKLVTSKWTICVGKNLGRSNETSPVEQAALEVAANYADKLKHGYFESIDQIDAETYFKPMLAEKYEDYPVTNFTGVTSQPKLDGVRCTVSKKHGLRTRKGEPIPSCPHIYEALLPLFDHLGDDAVFDGELYNHGLKEDFNEIISLVKKKKPTTEHLAKTAQHVEYWIYDLPNHPGTFIERFEALESALIGVWMHELRLVPTEGVRSQADMDLIYGEYLDAGYEGQMIRHDKLYQNKRTKFLLKRKEFEDAEFPIISVHEGVGNKSGMVGYLTLALPDGRTFKSAVNGTNGYLTELLARADSLIGKEATVVFFKPTPAGIPRFPKVKTVHETPRI